MKVQPHKRFHGVYEGRKGRRIALYTKSLLPGKKIYGENTHRQGGEEFREWDPQRSKISAALHCGISQMGIYPGNIVLYLGASTGTTVSHISDLVGETGFVFALDFAPRTTKELIFLSEDRKNIAPILESANHIVQMAPLICQADVIIQDIAQKAQAEIFLKNCDAFLKKGGFAIFSVKARSIDVTKKPKHIFRMIREKLERKITIVDYRELDPFEKDHAVFVCKKK